MKVFAATALLAVWVTVASSAPAGAEISLPCTIDGVVYESGSTFTLPDQSKCFVYQCDDGAASIIEKGCEDNSGICREVGETFSAGGCVTYKCVAEDRDGQTYYSVKVDALGCQGSDGNCYGIGETWVVNCNTYECSTEEKDGKTYLKSDIVDVACKDADGNCHGEEDIFSLVIQGNTYSNCRCEIVETAISYKCSG